MQFCKEITQPITSESAKSLIFKDLKIGMVFVINKGSQDKTKAVKNHPLLHNAQEPILSDSSPLKFGSCLFFAIFSIPF